MRNEYKAVTNTPRSTLRYAIQYVTWSPVVAPWCQCDSSHGLDQYRSFEKKPDVPGKPIKASEPTSAVQ